MPAAELTSRRFETANDYRSALADIYRRGLTDGLPVVPPTEDLVREMLDYAGLNGGEVIASLMPNDVEVTAEKIAVNAVMAGCVPEYLPVVIAAVKAVAQPQFNLLGVQGTTNPVAPVLVINGPIRKALDVNCGRGCLGAGWRANATIGRAMRLILVNCGGAIPAEVDKATHGMPGKYSFCFGELDESNPWHQPYHVEKGFAAEQSTVSVFGGQGTSNILAQFLEPDSVLHMLADCMRCYGFNTYLHGEGSPLVILNPGHAKIFADHGFDKKRIKEELFERTKIPRSYLPAERPLLRPCWVDAPPERMLQICRQPDDIAIVVAGGPEAYHITYVPSFGYTMPATVAIDEPGKTLT
ncbi:MAG: hypothetical protein K0R58_1911 [Ramlibacter sp.]|nr:hypothetical protein [Ramlibacter sp.]